MALFKRLLQLHQNHIPLEDFLTEIVAYLFEAYPLILEEWLSTIGVLPCGSYSVDYVATQQKHSPLEHHLTGSRPDLQIGLSNDSEKVLIFIESKVDSHEGYNQLQRYAEILNSFHSIQHKFLVYITRDFDPKNLEAILSKSDNSVKFKQTRWYNFYQFLRSQSQNLLINEICKLLEEYNMALNQQFSPVDVLSLVSFPKAIRLMEETIWGKVYLKFKEIVGGNKHSSNNLKDLERHERYIIKKWFQRDWWCGLGYDLRATNAADYPNVLLFLEVPPFSNQREEIIKAMREIVQKYGWEIGNLDNPGKWARISRQRNLRYFLSREDHVQQIEHFFLESLEELAKIKQEYPHLPWLATEQDAADVDEMILEEEV